VKTYVSRLLTKLDLCNRTQAAILAHEPACWSTDPSRRAPINSTTPVAAAGNGVLVASHDPVVVAAADRVVRLGDGRVVEA
jgi:putative ABC transport system ATP-binding protein